MHCTAGSALTNITFYGIFVCLFTFVTPARIIIVYSLMNSGGEKHGKTFLICFPESSFIVDNSQREVNAWGTATGALKIWVEVVCKCTTVVF